jgi:hypothetical protein
MKYTLLNLKFILPDENQGSQMIPLIKSGDFLGVLWGLV